jgi:hypothetical protein
LVASKPPETVSNLDREGEFVVTTDTDGVNMKTWQWQELDNLQLQISTMISAIEAALIKCVCRYSV